MENALHPKSQDKATSAKIFWVAGCSALLSAVTLLLAFTIPNKAFSQGMIFIISPLLLLPVLPVLHRLFVTSAYDLSTLTLFAGLIGMASILINLLLTGILQLAEDGSPVYELTANIQTLVVGFTILVGLWIALTGHAGLTTKIFPLGLSVVAIVAGLTRIIIISNLVLSSFSAFPNVALSGLWNLGLVLWIASHVVWAGWLGIWFLSSKRKNLLV